MLQLNMPMVEVKFIKESSYYNHNVYELTSRIDGTITKLYLVEFCNEDNLIEYYLTKTSEVMGFGDILFVWSTDEKGRIKFETEAFRALHLNMSTVKAKHIKECSWYNHNVYELTSIVGNTITNLYIIELSDDNLMEYYLSKKPDIKNFDDVLFVWETYWSDRIKFECE